MPNEPNIYVFECCMTRSESTTKVSKLYTPRNCRCLCKNALHAIQSLHPLSPNPISEPTTKPAMRFLELEGLITLLWKLNKLSTANIFHRFLREFFLRKVIRLVDWKRFSLLLNLLQRGKLSATPVLRLETKYLTWVPAFTCFPVSCFPSTPPSEINVSGNHTWHHKCGMIKSMSTQYDFQIGFSSPLLLLMYLTLFLD